MVDTVPIPVPEAYLHMHLCLLVSSVGEGLSFQETNRAAM